MSDSQALWHVARATVPAATGAGGPRATAVRRMISSLRARGARFRPSEPAILVVTSVLVGVGTGVAAIAFRWLIQAVGRLSHETLPAALGALSAPDGWMASHGYLLLAPAIGGLATGILVHRYAREAAGSGVPEVMAAVALHGGRIRPIVMIVKPLASALTIGSGGSAGREGPMVQTGSALGSFVGQRLHLSDERVRHLVACGAAGGIAATFNTPIAGVFFALEVVLGRFGVANFGPVVLAAVSASVVGRFAFGDVVAFGVPEYSIRSVWEFPMYAALGVVAALVAVTFTRALYGVAEAFRQWSALRPWLRPAVGGLLVGAIAVAYRSVPPLSYEGVPPTFGVGYDVIEAALHNEHLLEVMVSLLVLKFVTTALTLGSGGSGGVFAPALFLGSMLGGAFGEVANRVVPQLTAPPGAYALVGMGAVFAGASLAPITAVMTLFEMTGDYRIILPLMMTVAISTALARRWLDGESIYTLKLSRRGIHLSHGMTEDVMQGVLVEEVMHVDVPTVGTSMTLGDLGDTFARTQLPGFPVLDEDGKLTGIVAVQDTRKAIENGLGANTPVGEVASAAVVTARPGETIAEALHAMAIRGVEQLPVVAEHDATRLLGMVSHTDIVRAYNIALARRAEVQHRAARTELRNIDRVEFAEILVPEHAPCVGRTIQDLAPRFPDEFVLVSIRRASGQVIIPHGHTVFRPGDRVTAFVATEAEPEARRLLLGEDA